MRFKTIVFLLFWAASVFSQSNTTRKGFIFGAAAGMSSVSLSSDLIGSNHQFGLSFPNLKFGWMVAPKTAVAVLLPGSVYQYKWSDRSRDRGFEGIVPSVQHWVKDRWWLLGGAGLGMDAPAFYDIKDETERKFHFGAAGVAATGFEIWRHGRFALDLQARIHAGFAKAPEGARRGAAFSVLVGFNWY